MDWKLDPYGIIWSNGSTARTTGPLDGLVLVDSFVQKVPLMPENFWNPKMKCHLIIHHIDLPHSMWRFFLYVVEHVFFYISV